MLLLAPRLAQAFQIEQILGATRRFLHRDQMLVAAETHLVPENLIFDACGGELTEIEVGCNELHHVKPAAAGGQYEIAAHGQTISVRPNYLLR